MKTPEELAEEYVAHNRSYPYNSLNAEDRYMKNSYLVGYQAAKDQYAAKLKEANDTIAGMADECEGLKTIIYDNEETNLPTPAKWISVNERLPELGLECIWWSGCDFCVSTCCYDDIDEWECGYTHWMPLPEPPKEEK